MKPSILDSQGRLILGPRGEAPNAAKIQIKPEVDDSTGVVLDGQPSAVGSNERVGIRLGDWWITQDSAADGTKNLAVLDSDGTRVATIAEASELTTPYPRSTVLFKSALPLVILPTGTMADDGALTSGTANDVVIVESYAWFPAGALWVQDLIGPPIVAADSPAGWYYTVWTGADTADVFKDTWDGASAPTIPANPIPIVSTADGSGPGAFTGPTLEAEYVTIPIPASLPGDLLRVTITGADTDNANVKTVSVGINGTSMLAYTLTSLGLFQADATITEAATDEQLLTGTLRGDAASLVVADTGVETETTSAAWGLGVFLTRADATDNVQLFTITVERLR